MRILPRACLTAVLFSVINPIAALSKEIDLTCSLVSSEDYAKTAPTVLIQIDVRRLIIVTTQLGIRDLSILKKIEIGLISNIHRYLNGGKKEYHNSFVIINDREIKFGNYGLHIPAFIVDRYLGVFIDGEDNRYQCTKIPDKPLF